MIFLSLLSALLLSLVVVMFLYIRFLLENLRSLSDNIGWYFDRIEEFREHLEIVNNMESFNGEPIIFNLLKHVQALSKDTMIFKEPYELTHNDKLIQEEKTSSEE